MSLLCCFQLWASCKSWACTVLGMTCSPHPSDAGMSAPITLLVYLQCILQAAVSPIAGAMNCFAFANSWSYGLFCLSMQACLREWGDCCWHVSQMHACERAAALHIRSRLHGWRDLTARRRISSPSSCCCRLWHGHAAALHRSLQWFWL